MWGYWRRIFFQNGGNSAQSVGLAEIRNTQCGGHDSQ